ncbi:MAG: PilZ domain-containing protein [Acidobacteriaceae bacterium]|nr:PilZ domain-containing protein [Acidobacteriaceae bacterium]
MLATTAAAEFAIPVKLSLRDGLRECVDAQIARVNAGFLVLRSPIALEAGRTLDVAYLDRQIACETVYCHSQQGGLYKIGVRMLDGMDGALRIERRIRLDASATLNTPGLPGSVIVRVIDMSSSGLGVKIREPLRVGDLAYVELEHGVAFGEIRHCAKIPGEKAETAYRAGVFIEEFIPRNPAKINPWTAHGVDAPGRSSTFKVSTAIKSALFSGRKS